MAKGLYPTLPYKWEGAEKMMLKKTNIAGFFFDAFLEIDHDREAIITTHPVQQGANIADHIYINPPTVTMHIAMSDVAQSLEGGQFNGPKSTRSVSAYDVLVTLMNNRLPFQVTTRVEIYQNMVIKTISTSDSYKTLYGLDTRVELQQVLISSVKTVAVGTRPGVGKLVSDGSKSASEMDSSEIEKYTEVTDPGILPQTG
jgi:hypothetical protein